MPQPVRLIASSVFMIFVFILTSACLANTGPAISQREDPNSPDATLVAMIECFRANCLPNFRDAVYDPGDGRWHLPNERPDITIEVQQACASVMPQRQPPSPIPSAQLHDLLDFAKCMRTHGMPNFPDPGIDGVFHGTRENLGSSSIRSPMPQAMPASSSSPVRAATFRSATNSDRGSLR